MNPQTGVKKGKREIEKKKRKRKRKKPGADLSEWQAVRRPGFPPSASHAHTHAQHSSSMASIHVQSVKSETPLAWSSWLRELCPVQTHPVDLDEVGAIDKSYSGTVREDFPSLSYFHFPFFPFLFFSMQITRTRLIFASIVWGSRWPRLVTGSFDPRTTPTEMWIGSDSDLTVVHYWLFIELPFV